MKHIPQKGDDYDAAVSSIECNADKIGARIFVFEWAGIKVRVLAFDAGEAEEKAVDELFTNLRLWEFCDDEDDLLDTPVTLDELTKFAPVPLEGD